MLKLRFTLVFVTASLISANVLTPAQAVDNGEQPITFTTGDGEQTSAFRGHIMVPENRADPNSRNIPLVYVRFPAIVQDQAQQPGLKQPGQEQNDQLPGNQPPGPPIIYLAGGPGGSGIATAQYRRFPMFMALRRYGDVIALDQRGAGASDELPECQSQQTLPPTRAVTDSEFIAAHRKALRECLEFWQAQGVDIAGYNTLENARDLDALRRHLGADQVVLWGTSYGSHLALAALKVMEAHIAKLILSSAEGLNQTIKYPARTDAYFQRLQEALNTQADARQAYPDIKALIHRVHQQLEQKPVRLRLTLADGSHADYLWQRRDMQQMAAALIADPDGAARLLSLYLAMDHGITTPFEQFLGNYIQPGRPITLKAMPIATDIASGITDERRAEIARQAASALLKDYLNFTYHYDGVAPQLDLGDDFRTAPQSDVPVLLFSGTLDGRTYIESQREAVAGLKNVTLVTVENAGHNLFMASPAVQKAINQFMEDQAVTRHITIPLPPFAPPTP